MISAYHSVAHFLPNFRMQNVFDAVKIFVAAYSTDGFGCLSLRFRDALLTVTSVLKFNKDVRSRSKIPQGRVRG